MGSLNSANAFKEIKIYPGAIRRVCSYHRRDFDLVVIRSRPHEMHRVETSLQSAFQSLATASLGLLDRLPPEVLSMVLCGLDVGSYFYFRQVIRRARVASTELWEYALVSKHGLEGIRGLLRSGLACHFAITGLYTTLLTDKCSSCAGFGGHLFLFTMERYCFMCLQSEPRYRVLPLSTFAKIEHISPSRLTRLSVPTLRTVTGIYNMMETPTKPPKLLVHEEGATRTLLDKNALGTNVVQELSNRNQKDDQRFMVAVAYPSYSLPDAKLERGVSCKGCQARLEALRDGSDDRDHVFSPQGYQSHFKQCAESQDMWAESEQGTHAYTEPELSRRCGYFDILYVLPLADTHI